MGFVIDAFMLALLCSLAFHYDTVGCDGFNDKILGSGEIRIECNHSRLIARKVNDNALVHRAGKDLAGKGGVVGTIGNRGDRSVEVKLTAVVGYRPAVLKSEF